MELVISAAAVRSSNCLNCGIAWNEVHIFSLQNFTILFGSDPKALGNNVVLVDALVSPVSHQNGSTICRYGLNIEFARKKN